ncbi:hypothetical protein [Eggerthella sinensis]|uniref:hypothetical protein n=1 Tax=Eggerthella sinensis TaxID=242230 RepID=UPI0022E2CB64|nr:hypothetical protein [Eggerthella sinensis]
MTADETVDADVVIVGLGHSGTQAFLAACETVAEANGGKVDGKVVAVEKQLESAMSWYGEDFGCFNAKFVTDQGFGTWNTGDIVNEFVTRGGGRNYPDIVRAYVENSGATLDHMLEVAAEMGIDERCYTYDNTQDGWVIVQANMDYDKIQAGTDIYECLNKTNYPLTPGTKTWAGAVQFMGEYNDEPIQASPRTRCCRR